MTFATTPTTTTAAAAAPPGLATPPGLQQQQQQQQQQQTESKLVAFTNAISRVAKSPTGSAREALAMLGRMRQEGVAPTSATLNAVIDSQAKHADRDGSARVALQILDAMKNSTVRDVRPTTVTYTSAMDCLAKCSDGDARTAIALLEEMVSEGLVPNNITFGCAINSQARAKHGSAKMATVLLRKMVQRGLAPSQPQYNAVLNCNAKCHDGSAKDAKLVLDHMLRSGIEATVAAYSTVIEANAKKEDGSAAVAANCLVQLLEQGLVPDSVTFVGVIDAQAKRKDGSAKTAVMILSRMSRCCTPNLIHFNSALNACASERPAAIELAEPVLEAMLQRGFAPNSFTLSALFRCAGFAQPARPDLARRWFAQFCTSGNVDLNDHVARALRVPLGNEADELLESVGSPLVARRRVIRRGSGLLGSPGSGSGSGRTTGSSPDWRSTGARSERPSASLFATARRSDSWRSERSASRSRSPSPPSSPPASPRGSTFGLLSTGPRTSLADKINSLKQQRSREADEATLTFPAAAPAAPARKASALLPPSHFSLGANSCRAPAGPDGSRGFTARRSQPALVC